MSVDFPRAWQIARSVPFEEHDPKCSYRLHTGGFLCDCHILFNHPEYLDDVFQGKDGKIIKRRHEMDGLIEGRMVHYVLPNGKHVPAIITAVWNENGLVNLQAITDGSNSLPYSQPEKESFENFGIDLEQVKHGHIWRTSRSYSEEPKPDTWHWIERTSEPVGETSE